MFVNLKDRTLGTTHQCGEMYCRKCDKWGVDGEHKCFLKKPELKPYEEHPKLIIFDYETATTEEGRHVPCAVISQYIDGREFRFPPDGVPMAGYNVNRRFCQWLFSEQHKEFTMIAHNFRSYDGQFVLEYMLDNGLKPDVIKNGTKLMDLRFDKLKMRARDTLNYMAMPLSALPKALGLPTDLVSKGEFPHRANRPCKWDKFIPFPDVDQYMIEKRSKNDRREFAEWHTAEKARCGSVMDFRKVLMDYCFSDVTVIRKVVLKLRSDFRVLTKIDILEHVTIASACRYFYATSLMVPNEIALISAHGYQANRKTSLEATE